MLERPLLYIVSPTYVVESRELDESTSVYERNVPEKITNELIARQLNYFARAYKSRSLIFVLSTGERVIGEILSVQDTDVKIVCFDQTRIIPANTIVGIYVAK